MPCDPQKTRGKITAFLHRWASFLPLEFFQGQCVGSLFVHIVVAFPSQISSLQETGHSSLLIFRLLVLKFCEKFCKKRHEVFSICFYLWL